MKEIISQLSTSIYIIGPLSIWLAIAIRWGLRVNQAIKKNSKTPENFSLKFFWFHNRWSIVASFTLSTLIGFAFIFFYGGIQVWFHLPLPEELSAFALFVLGWFWEKIAKKMENLDMDAEEAVFKLTKKD